MSFRWTGAQHAEFCERIVHIRSQLYAIGHAPIQLHDQGYTIIVYTISKVCQILVSADNAQYGRVFISYELHSNTLFLEYFYSMDKWDGNHSHSIITHKSGVHHFTTSFETAMGTLDMFDRIILQAICIEHLIPITSLPKALRRLSRRI